MTKSKPGCRSATPDGRRVVGLGLFAVAVLWGWGWALPRLAKHDSIRQQINHAERFGINPGALYYTDVFNGDAFAPGRAIREAKTETQPSQASAQTPEFVPPPQK